MTESTESNSTPRVLGIIFLKILGFMVVSATLLSGLAFFFPEILDKISWAEAVSSRPTWMSWVLYGGMVVYCLLILGLVICDFSNFWAGLASAGGLFLYAWKGIPFIAGFLYRHSYNLPMDVLLEAGSEMQQMGFEVDPQTATGALGASVLGEISRLCIVNFGALGTCQLLFIIVSILVAIGAIFFD